METTRNDSTGHSAENTQHFGLAEGQSGALGRNTRSAAHGIRSLSCLGAWGIALAAALSGVGCQWDLGPTEPIDEYAVYAIALDVWSEQIGEIPADGLPLDDVSIVATVRGDIEEECGDDILGCYVSKQADDGEIYDEEIRYRIDQPGSAEGARRHAVKTLAHEFVHRIAWLQGTETIDHEDPALWGAGGVVTVATARYLR